MIFSYVKAALCPFDVNFSKKVLPFANIFDIIFNAVERWGCSSIGRAPALHAGGSEFKSRQLHHHGTNGLAR